MTHELKGNNLSVKCDINDKMMKMIKNFHNDWIWKRKCLTAICLLFSTCLEEDCLKFLKYMSINK